MKKVRWSGYRIMQEVRSRQELGLILTHSDGPKEYRYESLRPVLCDRPFGIQYYWTPQEGFADVGLVDRPYSPDGSLDEAVLVELIDYAPCRSCKQCNQRKVGQLVWDIRHVAGSYRNNAFATLTFGKQFRFKFADGHTAAANAGVHELGKLFAYLRHHCRFKAFWVQEAHADGFPHFHVLFSFNDDTDIKGLIKQWWQRHGISNVKSLETSEHVRTRANYMAKYMFKNGEPRWSRSQGYTGAAQPKASSDGQ